MPKYNSNKDTVNFDFIFDDKGAYTYSMSEYGFGKKVKIKGKITSPEDGGYSADIVSSDGGGGKWNNIKANEEIECIINTSILHKTNVTVTIYSDKPNSNGHAVIYYEVC